MINTCFLTYVCTVSLYPGMYRIKVLPPNVLPVDSQEISFREGLNSPSEHSTSLARLKNESPEQVTVTTFPCFTGSSRDVLI